MNLSDRLLNTALLDVIFYRTKPEKAILSNPEADSSST
jgi:hypothetical protein